MKRLAPLALLPLAAALLAAAPAAAQPIDVRAGEDVQGHFTSTDPVLPDGSHFRIYRFRGTPGQPITVTLHSPDFDAFLTGGTMHGDRFEAADYDDDGAGGTDARLDARVGPDGTYHVRANTLMGGETGAYTLRVEHGSEGGGHHPRTNAPPAEVREISLGQTIQGRLTPSDAVLEDGTYYHLYRLRAGPGQEIVVTLRSADFDAYLAGGGMEGGRQRMDDRDDDGAGGTDARIHARVGADGTYHITANTLLAGETGAYTLTVEAAPAAGK
jgi:hypothetical protein